MALNPDTALDALNRAVLAFVERGLEGYLRWLEQEHSRIRIVLEAHQLQGQADTAPSPPAATVTADSCSELLKALEFYADDSNYQPRRNSRPAAVLADSGARARDALEDFDRQQSGAPSAERA